MDIVNLFQVFTHIKLWNKSVSLTLSFEFRLEIKLVDIKRRQESESVVEKMFFSSKEIREFAMRIFFRLMKP